MIRQLSALPASVAAFATVVLATLLCVALDPLMSIAGLAMVFLVATVICATAMGLVAGVVAALLGVSALNYFFIPPRYTFEVDGAEYWWLLAVLLGLSLALSSLVAALRERKARAEAGELRAAQLHALSEELADCADHETMALRAATWMHRNTGRPCAVYLVDAGGALRWFTDPAVDEGYHQASVQWALDHGRTLGRGCLDWPDLPLWCAPFARREAGGAVQLLWRATEPPPRQTVRHWEALARQVGLCIGRAQAAQSARLAQDSARSEAARNTLLASLSHDLRTPLAGIVGTASTLRTQGDALPAAQRERLLANLELEARDLTLMADNVLQMSRLSQPQAQLRMEWEAVDDILGAAVARTRRRWEGVKLELRVARGLPPVRAEAGLFAQAVANLVDNAVRHSPGAPHIVVTAGRSRDGVFVAVRDHGPGLPEGDPAALFERYRQGASRGDGAAGLGLAICKLAVQAHGGRIQAKRCAPGTEFRIDLPAMAADAVPHE